MKITVEHSIGELKVTVTVEDPPSNSVEETIDLLLSKLRIRPELVRGKVEAA